MRERGTPRMEGKYCSLLPITITYMYMYITSITIFTCTLLILPFLPTLLILPLLPTCSLPALPIIPFFSPISLSLSPPLTLSPSCNVIHFLMEKMPLKWLLVHQLTFVMAFLYVLLDLTNEVSSGTVTLAKNYMDELLTQVSVGEYTQCMCMYIWVYFTISLKRGKHIAANFKGRGANTNPRGTLY